MDVSSFAMVPMLLSEVFISVSALPLNSFRKALVQSLHLVSAFKVASSTYHDPVASDLV